MTKKNFLKTANVLRNGAKAIKNSGASDKEKHYALFELRSVMYHFSELFAQENSRFDEIAFLEACKVEKYLKEYNILLEI